MLKVISFINDYGALFTKYFRLSQGDGTGKGGGNGEVGGMRRRAGPPVELGRDRESVQGVSLVLM